MFKGPIIFVVTRTFNAFITKMNRFKYRINLPCSFEFAWIRKTMNDVPEAIRKGSSTYIFLFVNFKILGINNQGIYTSLWWRLHIKSKYCKHKNTHTRLLQDRDKAGWWVNVSSSPLSKIEKVPKGIRGEKSSKDIARSRTLVSTIGTQANPTMGDGTRCPEG